MIKLKRLRHPFLLTLILHLWAQTLWAQAPVTKLWDKTYGGSEADELTSIVETADGGYLLGGTSSGGGGDKTGETKGEGDYWIVKVTAAGNKVWDKTYGGNGNEVLKSLLLTADGGVLMGGHSNSGAGDDKTEASRGNYDYWLVKLNADGSKAWDKTYGGNDIDYFFSMTPSTDGGYLLAGYSRSLANGDKSEAPKGGADYWVVKINVDGTKAWDRTIGGTGLEMLYAVSTTPDGGFLLGGRSESGANGDKTEASKGGVDFWIVKLNSDGTKAWDKTIGGSGSDILYSIAPASDGGFLIGGESNSSSGGDKTEASKGGPDFWVVKLHANGNKAWDRTYGGSGGDHLRSITTTPDGGFLLGGPSASGIGGDKSEASRGGLDYWVVKINSDGNIVWDKTIGGDLRDDLTTVITTTDGNYLLGGWTESGANGDKTEASKGLLDYWVIKIRESITSSPGDLKQASELNLLVYPNPSAKGDLHITLPDLKSGSEPLKLILYNTLGQQVLYQQVKWTDLQVGVMLQTSGIPSGTYYLQLQLSDRMLTKKVIIN